MKKITLYLFVAMMSWGCSGHKFTIQSTNVNPTNFDQFDAFKYFNPNKLPKSNFTFNEAQQKIIFDAVAGEMRQLGYKSHQDARLIVRIQGGTEKIFEQANYRADPFYSYYGYPGYPYAPVPNYSSENPTTIIIDILDAKTNKLLWQGVGFGEFNPKKDPPEVKLPEVIHEIFKEFPQQKSQSPE